MPSYFPENNTPLPDDTEVRSLQKINGLLDGGVVVSVGEVEVKNDAGNPVPISSSDLVSINSKIPSLSTPNVQGTTAGRILVETQPPSWSSTSTGGLGCGHYMGTPVYPGQNGTTATSSLRGGYGVNQSNCAGITVSNTTASTKLYLKIFDNPSTTIGNPVAGVYAVAANMDILVPANTTLNLNFGWAGIRFTTTAMRCGVSTAPGLTSALGSVSSGDLIVQARITP